MSGVRGGFGVGARRLPPVPIAFLLRSRSSRGSFPRATGKRIYSFIPSRLAVPLCELAASAPEMAACILLGFSTRGPVIYSYSAGGGGGGFELQMWSVEWRCEPARALLVARVPLFSSFDVGAADVDGDELHVSLLEAASGYALVASAIRVVRGGGLGGGTSSGGTTIHISLLPGAACVTNLKPAKGTPVPVLGAEHFCYRVSPPFPRLRPASLALVHAGATTMTHALALNTGTAIVHVSFAIEMSASLTAAASENTLPGSHQPRSGPAGCILRTTLLRPPPSPLSRATATSASPTYAPRTLIRAYACVDSNLLLPALVGGVVSDYDLRFVRLLSSVSSRSSSVPGYTRSNYPNVSPCLEDDDGASPGDAHAILCAAIVDHQSSTNHEEKECTPVYAIAARNIAHTEDSGSSDWAFVAAATASAPPQRTFGRQNQNRNVLLRASGSNSARTSTPPEPSDAPPLSPSLSLTSTASLSPRPTGNEDAITNTDRPLIRSLVFWRASLSPSSSSSVVLSSVRECVATLPAALQPGLDDVDGRDLAAVWRDQAPRVAAHGAPARYPSAAAATRELNNDAFIRGRSLRSIICPSLPLAIVA